MNTPRPYLPRCEPLLVTAHPGADHQADIARATLTITTPDGQRHHVEVTFYASPLEPGALVLDIDTPDAAGELIAYLNDHETGRVTD